MSDEKPTAANEIPKTLTFSYLKSNHFRVIHIDGAVASTGPSGVFLSLFNERAPIPQQQTFVVDIERQRLGDELMDKRVTRTGVVREVEAGIMMSASVAKELAELLLRQIDALPLRAAKSDRDQK